MLTRKAGRREIAVVLAAAGVCATAGFGTSSDDVSVFTFTSATGEVDPSFVHTG
jgi:hypothetical protein